MLCHLSYHFESVAATDYVLFVIHHHGQQQSHFVYAFSNLVHVDGVHQVTVIDV